jgi:SAM-dependent methyltransferase
MPLHYSNPQLFPDDTNPLPTSGSKEQQALLEDELEIATEAYFQRLQQFSEVTDNIFPELMSACRNVVAQALPGKKLRVLDLCSGIGIVSLELLKADFPIERITMADMSPEILGRAAALLEKRHGAEVGKRLRTVVTDLLVHDLRETLAEEYDLIVTCNAFQHFPRERQAELFKQIRDMLAPNGVFVFESHFKLLRPNWKQYLVHEYQTRMRQQGAPEEFVLKAAEHINGFHNYVNLSDAYNWLEAAEFGYYECVFRKDEIGILAAVR